MGSMESHSGASERTQHPVTSLCPSNHPDGSHMPTGSGEITVPAGVTTQDVHYYNTASQAANTSPAIVVTPHERLVVRDRPIQPEQPVEFEAAPPLHEQRAAQVRQKILQQVGMYHNAKGIQVDRADRFVGALGLESAADRLIVSPQHLPAALQAIGRAGIQYANLAEGGARYYPELGLTLISRTENLSNSEEQVVHESIHASAGIIPGLRPLKIISTPSGAPNLTPQWGLITLGGGQWLEEGFTRITQHEYSRQVQLAPSRTYAEQWRHACERREPYTYMREDHPYAPAAMGWGAMFTYNPSLIDAVFRSRQHPEAIQDVARGIDAIRPGLYSTLISARRDTAGDDQAVSFDDGLSSVLEATGITHRDFSDISSEGPFVHYVHDKLERYSRRTGYAFR